MQFGLGPLSDLPVPRKGDEILPFVTEMAKRLNRRIEGPYVRQTPQGVWIGNPEQIFQPSTKKRGRLKESLYGCSSAKATEIVVDSTGKESDGAEFTAYDPLDKVLLCPASIPDSHGLFYIPAGTCVDTSLHDDSGHYEFDEPGACCVSGGSSSGSSGSQGSGPGSGSGSSCTPWPSHLPQPPDGGTYVPVVSGGCIQFVAPEPCPTTSGTGAGTAIDGGSP